MFTLKVCINVAVLLLTFPNFISSDFPAAVERCKAGDTKCLARTITNIMNTHPSGIPEIGLAPIDPLYFGTSIITEQASSALSMNLSISNGNIIGWKNMQIKKVIGFEKDPRTSKFEIHAYVPKDMIVGNYSIHGHALLLPVEGNGPVKLVFDDLEMVVKFKTSVDTREGEDYLKINKIDIDISVKKMHVNFENLFNNKLISDNTNIVLNENQAAFFPEIRKSFGIARAAKLVIFLKPIFERIPYRKLFLE